MDFFDVTYLKYGNARQQQAFHAIYNLNIINKLQGYSPILVGTIPIAIDIDKSDLDVIGEVSNFKEFQTILQKEFGDQMSFRMKEKQKDNKKYVVANFHYQDFNFEIFGQGLPINLQNGYRHMLLEYRLLKLFGPAFQENVIHLKHRGLKTEPAFSYLLNLSGDPYMKLLELETFTDEELKAEFQHILDRN